jgi:GNAT superfamily N-acetyltransferase
MDANSCSIGGEFITVKVVGRMEETLQAFAVRAACFIGELDLPYTREFDGQDFGATHLLACLGKEPVGALRVRWLQSFAMPERLAVMQRFRGHDVGALMLEKARNLAESRGCRLLYARVPPDQTGYFERHGWQRLDETAGPVRGPVAAPTVALVRPVDPSQTGVILDDHEVVALSRQYGLDSSAAVHMA